MIRSFNSAKDDLAQILAIEQCAQNFPWTAEQFKECLKSPVSIYIVEKCKVIIGFMILGSWAQEMHILNICIHPDYQRQGYGKELLMYACHIATEKNCSNLYLEARRSNINALNLYYAQGFRQIGERKNYYVSQAGYEDALVLAKEMSEWIKK